jgi:dihydropteroate synthase
MLSAGADLIDVGGESTRPGSAAVETPAEIERVIPVIAALAADGAVVSVDTSKPEVAAAALDVGAAVINDVTAFTDPAMVEVAADSAAGIVVMHMLGSPRTMQDDPHYDDVVGEVASFLTERADRARAAGIHSDRICIDPGIGFGKTLEHNLQLLAGMPRLTAMGFPVLVGASRKSWIPALIGDIPVTDREIPTAVAHALAIAGGASAIRVHDVVAGLRTARVADAIVGLRGGSE